MGNKKTKTIELFCPPCGFKFEVEINEKQPYRQEIRCPMCYSTHVIEYGKFKSSLRVEGSNANEVKKVMLTLMKETGQQLDLKHTRNPWFSGSFYLATMITVAVLFLVIAKQVHVIVFPIVLVGSLLAVSIIGAFQMRQDKSLSEKSFLSLMALTFRQLPFIRKIDDDKNLK